MYFSQKKYICKVEAVEGGVVEEISLAKRNHNILNGKEERCFEGISGIVQMPFTTDSSE